MPSPCSYRYMSSSDTFRLLWNILFVSMHFGYAIILCIKISVVVFGLSLVSQPNPPIMGGGRFIRLLLCLPIGKLGDALPRGSMVEWEWQYSLSHATWVAKSVCMWLVVTWLRFTLDLCASTSPSRSAFSLRRFSNSLINTVTSIKNRAKSCGRTIGTCRSGGRKQRPQLFMHNLRSSLYCMH